MNLLPTNTNLRRAAVLAVTAAVVAPGIASAAPAPGAPGVGDALWPGNGNGGYRVEHQLFAFDFAAGLESYTAVSTLTVKATQELSRFNLDLLGPKVRDVFVDAKAVEWQNTPEGELVITPSQPLHAGQTFTVRVGVSNELPDIEKDPSSFKGGIFRAMGFVQLANQPSDARRVLAVDDHPSKKAPATISITTTGDTNSIANGRPVATVRVGDRTTRVFDERRPIATELLQVGAGPFTVTRKKGPHGIDLTYAVPTTTSAASQPQLETVPKAIEFLEKRLGTFPGDHAGVYATPAGGALETQGLTWLNSEQLLPEEFENNGVDGVIAHELAHEWFGDSVSPAKWSDLWLNEGHAVFYESLWAEQKHPGAVERSVRATYTELGDKVLENGPIARPDPAKLGDNPHRPFTTAAYQGGAMVLYALRQEVGARTFERIERAWVAEHRDSLGDTEQYIATASRIAGRDLAGFLGDWLYGTTLPPMPGHPDWKPAPAA